MADNFNLRTFLSENKLTKNAKLLKEEVSLNGKPVDIRSIEIDGVDIEDYPDFVDAYIIAADYEDGTPLSDEELQELQDENYGIVGELIHDRQLYLQEKKEETPEEGVDEYNSWEDEPYYDDVADDTDNKRWDTDTEEEDRYPEDIEEITLKENKMTTREQRLVEMVQRALGHPTENHQNADPNVPNDSTDMAIDMMKNGIPEVANDEMVEEKPLPTYESVEDLMKEIEHGTHKAMYEYKISEMKRIAKQLEEKVTTLEESELSAHINPADVKKMKKDILTLHKGVAKIEKEYDRKFNKKTKTSEPKAEKQEVALAETKNTNTMENFDLKKFLVENKLTANSRVLKENLDLEDPTAESLDQLRRYLKTNPDWAIEQLVSIYAGGSMHMADIAGDIFDDIVRRIEGSDLHED